MVLNSGISWNTAIVHNKGKSHSYVVVNLLGIASQCLRDSEY